MSKWKITCSSVKDAKYIERVMEDAGYLESRYADVVYVVVDKLNHARLFEIVGGILTRVKNPLIYLCKN